MLSNADRCRAYFRNMLNIGYFITLINTHYIQIAFFVLCRVAWRRVVVRFTHLMRHNVKIHFSNVPIGAKHDNDFSFINNVLTFKIYFYASQLVLYHVITIHSNDSCTTPCVRIHNHSSKPFRRERFAPHV